MDTKKQVLEKMYALRAGLSIVSQKYDELMTDNLRLSKMQVEVSQLKKPEYTGKKNTDVEQEVEEFNKNTAEIVDGSTQVVLHLCKKLKEENILYFYFLRKCVPSIVEFFYGISDRLISDYTSGLFYAIIILGYILVVPMSIPILLFDIISFPFILLSPTRLSKKNVLKAIKSDKHYKYIKEWGRNHPNDCTYMYQETVDTLFGMLKDFNYEFTSLDNKLIERYKAFTPSAIVHLQNYLDIAKKVKKQVGYKEVDENREEYRAQCADFDRDYDEKQRQYNDKVHSNEQLSLQISTECQLITKTLIESYSAVLDIRDWENLDFVIYSYETGRADNIKEALQLVDTERRNNNLINSIQQASQEICSNIKENFLQLGKTMIAGFESLSSQLEAQRIQIADLSREVCNTNINISNFADKVNTATNAIVTQQTLSNALLEKANVSSKEMVEQMKKLNTKLK